MPYVFQFFEHHELRFEEDLHGERCHAHNHSGIRCSRRTVIGYGLCWQHLLKEKHLRIKPSTIHGAGKGLFCINPKQPIGTVIYPANTKILQYAGTVETMQSLDDAYGNHTAPYAVELKHGMAEDAAARRSVAACINHKNRNQANCRLMVQQNNRAAVMTTKAIRNGDELFASYGSSYQLNPRDSSAYRTVYKS